MIPTIPPLPTDNLYKFMALCGLAMAVACAGLRVVNERNIIEKANVYWTAYSVEVDVARRRQEMLFQDDKEELRNSDWWKQSEQQIDELRSRREPLQTAWRTAEESANRISSYLLFGIILGVGMMVFGFELWYFRVQRVLDESLALERALKKQQLKAASVGDPEPSRLSTRR
ncbi:MAG: hypothetical protein H7Z14_14190 [Anaerolineae bacterium]|nr:hypothetical protein [Phycisphaerae bacterium]